MKAGFMDKKNHLFFGLSEEQLLRYICPILLAVVVCFASLLAFHEPAAYALGFLYLSAVSLLFSFFDRLRNNRRGRIIYIFSLSGALFLSIGLARLNDSIYGKYSFWNWFYGSDDVGSFAPLLLASLFLGGGFFLASVIYYFTAIRYRTMGLMLCTMFPYFLFSRRSRIMPDALTTLIILCFLAAVIHNRRLGDARSSKGLAWIQVDRAYILCIASFILITGALTAALDKPYYQAFFERESLMNDPFDINAGSSTGYEELSDRSSPRNARPGYRYEPLFYFIAESGSGEYYLRTQAFDYFNGQVWEISQNHWENIYSLEMPEYGIDNVAEDISALLGRGSTDLFLIRRGGLFDDDFTPEYLAAPYGIITDDRPSHLLFYYKDAVGGAVFRNWQDILNDAFSFYEAEPGLEDLAEGLGFSAQEYLEFLDSNGEREEALRLKEDYEKAMQYYSDLSNISEKLAALSRQIVTDCHSDLEKARRLESYFTENGYAYSLSFVPQDNSVDYFVFESKTGYCAGYATAMTLMARAVGLPARYVEGFAAYEKDKNGYFVIRDAHAHAFVEVYIPGAGWMTFDPTVPGYRSAAGGLQSVITKLFNLIDKISVVIAVAVLLLLFAMLERLKELFLRLSLLFKARKERIISLYANLIKGLSRSVGRDFSVYTPDMLRDYLLHERGAVPEKLIALFEKTAFGGYECSREEYQEAYREYRRCYRYVRKAVKGR